MERIPTTSLSAERTQVTNILTNLPQEAQYEVISKLDNSALINACLTNQNFIGICFDPYLGSLKQWTKNRSIYIYFENIYLF